MSNNLQDDRRMMGGPESPHAMPRSSSIPMLKMARTRKTERPDPRRPVPCQGSKTGARPLASARS